MNRFRAAATYLLASFCVAAAAFFAIYFLWYPGVLFETVGGRELFLLIVGVDVTIGPLLVLIVFKPGKKGLAFDLATIALLQLAALGYGTYVLFESRPVYIVFAKDRFELVRANAIPEEELRAAARGPWASLPLAGPRIIGTRLPKDPDEQFRLMMSALSAVDVQHLPRYYVDYDQVRPEVLARASPMARLRELNPQDGARIDGLVASLGRTEAGLRFLPLRAERKVDLAVIVDARTGDVLEITALRPWEYR